ncbi:hypothetical protein B0H14DRAFT_2418208 [Mycena olivaceomarginata]|nr:hypothetical protein B0H14DRAFT_2418208 [Mycena olivaceomarginata]
MHLTLRAGKLGREYYNWARQAAIRAAKGSLSCIWSHRSSSESSVLSEFVPQSYITSALPLLAFLSHHGFTFHSGCLCGPSQLQDTDDSQDQAAICSPPTAPVVRTVEDAISTRNILLTRFPLELVHIILDHAEYWRQVKAERQEEITCASAVFRANASLEYLATRPMIKPRS